MFTTLFYGHWEYWQLYHKVTFDGVNKLIVINSNEFNIDVKNDIYSDWKEWIQVGDNSKFLPALRSVGGDPINIPAGLYAGDSYFLINGWRVVIPHNVNISGVLYTEEGDSPYLVQAGGGVIATVSNLVQTVVMQVAAVNTPAEIADAVRIELTPELAKINSQVDGLTPQQTTMLLELYRIMGLDPTRPLVVSNTARSVGAEISQTINSTPSLTTVTRV